MTRKNTPKLRTARTKEIVAQARLEVLNMRREAMTNKDFADRLKTSKTNIAKLMTNVPITLELLLSWLDVAGYDIELTITKGNK